RACRGHAPRGDGLLRSPAKGGERIHGEEEGGQEEEEVRTASTERQDILAREEVRTSHGEEEGGQEEEEVGTPCCATVGGGGLPPHKPHAGGGPPLPLCLNDLRDLSGLQAASADADTLSFAVDHRPHPDQVRQPAPLRQLVSVADRVTDGGALPADIAPLRHGYSFVEMESPGMAPEPTWR